MTNKNIAQGKTYAMKTYNEYTKFHKQNKKQDNTNNTNTNKHTLAQEKSDY